MVLTPLELEKWIALVRFDEEIRAIAEKLAVYGDHWVYEFGGAYFALNEDRKYLQSISTRLLEEAERDTKRLAAEAARQKEIEWVSKFKYAVDGEPITTTSMDILRRAESNGYKIEVEANRKIAVSKGNSTSYLWSNHDIQRFGRHALKDDPI